LTILRKILHKWLTACHARRMQRAPHQPTLFDDTQSQSPTSNAVRPALSNAQIEVMANRMMKQHGLARWQFRWDHARNRCGACHFDNKTISLSTHFCRLNSEAEIEQTLLHEIAHALVGPDHAHDQTWQDCARRIGARTHATNTTAAMPKHKWLLVCTHCDRVLAKRHRRSLKLRYLRCRDCGPTHGALTWEPNSHGLGSNAERTPKH